jgi:hypothetical protein
MGLDRHAASTVDYLSGDWTVIRRISDHRTGQVGSFHGMASFQPAAETSPVEARFGPTLAYTESGELRLGGHRGPARRSMLVLDAGDGAADIRFADGREFYRLDLRTGSCAAAHPCRADQYHVTVMRLSADSYAETWRVTGPSKDYELHTTYTRAGHASAGDTSARHISARRTSARYIAASSGAGAGGRE